MRWYRLTLEYEGTAYHGWQVQPGLPTVQGTLQEALARLARAPVQVMGAGRTDAGVHASGQVASFVAALRLDPPVLQRALNALLPRDIAVVAAAEAPPGFDARRDARGRTYRYSLLCRPHRAALGRDLILHIPRPLDREAMAAAASCLVGEHDFSAFRAAHCSAPSPFRRVGEARFLREGDRLHFLITADAFLQHMVRIIMGTLLQVGDGKLTPQGFQAVLESRDRARAGKTLDPRGLCLVRVLYEEMAVPPPVSLPPSSLSFPG
jgi:tRNA pseudouridine38-40 synthase